MFEQFESAFLQAGGLFHAAQAFQISSKTLQHVAYAEIGVSGVFEKLFAIGEGHATFGAGATRFRQGDEKETRAFAQQLRGIGKFAGESLLGAQQRFDIAGEFFKAQIADADAEVAGSNVFQLVRFVEDDGSGFRAAHRRRALPGPDGAAPYRRRRDGD